MSARRSAFVLGLLAASSIVAAAPVPARIAAPVAGRTFHPGETIDVSVDLGGSDADEFELYLSLDDGRTFPVRLTRDLSAATRNVVITVPDLPCASARLLLRAGGDEPGERGDDDDRDAEGNGDAAESPRARAERNLWISAPFGIGGVPAARSSLPVADRGALARRGDAVHVEWWAEPPAGLRGVPEPPVSEGFDAGEPVWGGTAPVEDAAAPTRVSDDLSEDFARLTTGRAAAGPDPRSGAGSRPARSIAIPAFPLRP